MRLSSGQSRYMERDRTFVITLVFSPSPRQTIEETLEVSPGTTVAEILRQHKVAGPLCADTEDSHICGVWGKEVPLDYALLPHDRLELYRGLKVDPKVARRLRFTSQGARKVAGLFVRRRVGSKPGY